MKHRDEVIAQRIKKWEESEGRSVSPREYQAFIWSWEREHRTPAYTYMKRKPRKVKMEGNVINKSVYVQKVPIDSFRKVKSIAALRGITMQELWLEIIQLGLDTLTPKQGGTK